MSGNCNKVGDGTRQLEMEVHWVDQSALNNILVEWSYWPNTVTYHFSLNVNKCHQYNLVKKRNLNLDLSVNILPVIILIHSDWTQRKGEAVYHEWLTPHTNGPFSCTSYWKHYLHITSLVGDRAKGGSLYSEVECIMGNGHMVTTCEWTDTTENITFPQLLLAGSNKGGFYPCRSI